MEDNLDLEVLDNIAVGRNIQLYRRMADIKALDIAQQLGLKEAAYTKYERGETNITIDFVLKVAKILKVNPLFLLTVSPNNIIESGNNSPGAILGMVYGNYTFQTINDHQNQAMLKLIESVTELSNKVLDLIKEKK